MDVLQALGSSARLLSAAMTAIPSRTYQLSLFVKLAIGSTTSASGELWAWIVQFDKQGDAITGGFHLPTGAQASAFTSTDSQGWSQITTTFVSEPAVAAFKVYMGKPGNATTSFTGWVDDIMVLDLDAGLMNVIQTTVTDFVVRPLGTSRNDTRKLYAANKDYAVQPSIDPITLEPNFRAPIGFTQHNVNLTFKLKALPAGKLKAGDKVLVDYDFQVGCHDS